MLDVNTEGGSNEVPADAGSIGETLDILTTQFGRTVLFLDRFGGNSLEEMASAISPPVRAFPLVDPIFKDDVQRSPLLLELIATEPTHRALLKHSIVLAQEQVQAAHRSPHICAWLFTTNALQKLQRDMCQRLNVRYPRGGRVYLRYFDPRVMPRMAALLAPSTGPGKSYKNNISQLLGPVEIWCQLDREGYLISHHNPKPSNAPYGGNLHFDEHTAAALDRIETINRTALTLARCNFPCEQQADSAIDAHLIAAQRLGLHNQDDQVVYASHAVRLGPSFTLHPELNKWVNQVLRQGIPLESLLEKHM